MSIKLSDKKKHNSRVNKFICPVTKATIEWLFNLAFYIIRFFFIVGFIHLT